MHEPSDNRVMAAIGEGRAALILGVTLLRGAAAAAVARQAGCDGLFIDLEHGAYSLAEAADTCLAASLAGLAPLVRCRITDLSMGARLLDNGAQGIVVPQVGTAEQARSMVRALRPPPLGARSMGGSGLGLAPGTLASPAGRHRADAGLLVVATIEDAEGLANLDAIAATDGIDMLLLGATDLSFALGIPGDTRNPGIWQAALAIADAARRHGRIFGVGGVQSPAALAALKAEGAGMVLVGMDHGLLGAACAERVAAIREAGAHAHTGPGGHSPAGK